MYYHTGINYGSAIFALYLLICVIAVGHFGKRDTQRIESKPE